jgi:hypothetical protein
MGGKLEEVEEQKWLWGGCGTLCAHAEYGEVRVNEKGRETKEMRAGEGGCGKSWRVRRAQKPGELERSGHA